MSKTIEFIRKLWSKIDGNKTYISAYTMLLFVLIKSVFPNSIPDELYSDIKKILEVLIYGSASHGLYKKGKDVYNKTH